MSRPSMRPPDQTANVVRFGAFELDVAAGQLRKHGVRVRLQNQPLKILSVLLSRPGQVFTRDELVEQVWPKGIFVDFDRGLNAAVNRLRQTLRDSADNPRYVETVAGRGYRFIAPIQSASEEEPHPTWRVNGWVAGSAATVAIALFGFAALRFVESGSGAANSAKTFPLTAEPGEEAQPSISRDGNKVAFAHKADFGDADIYVKSIGSDGMVQVTSGPAHDLSPAWSPDGRSIAFVRLNPGGPAAVVRVPAEGGPEYELGRVHLHWFNEMPNTVGHLLAWSPDGRSIALSGGRLPDGPASILTISVATGETRWITQPPAAAWGDFSPSYSPDGQRLTFARYVGPTVSDIFVTDLPADAVQQSEPKRLTSSDGLSSSPIWTAGNEILFTCDCASATRRLWRVSASGTRAEPVHGIGENSFSLSYSAAKHRLVYSTQTADTNIVRVDLDRSEKESAKVSRIIASTRLENTPEYSPDGRQIAYQSERSGRDEIWVANSDGSSARQLTHLNSKVSGFPRWSPDGRSLVFHSRVDGPANLFIVDVENGTVRRLTHGTGENTAPSWSRDGVWIYFASRRSGQSQIWKISQAGGEAVPVTKAGASIGIESSDRHSLIYSKPGTADLWVLNLNTGVEHRAAGNLANPTTFAPAKRGVYLISILDRQRSLLELLNYKTGAVTPLAELPSRVSLGLSVSPGETSVLYTQLEYRGADLSLVEDLR